MASDIVQLDARIWAESAPLLTLGSTRDGFCSLRDMKDCKCAARDAGCCKKEHLSMPQRVDHNIQALCWDLSSTS